MSRADRSRAHDRAVLGLVLVAIFCLVAAVACFLLLENPGQQVAIHFLGSLVPIAAAVVCHRVSLFSWAPEPVRKFWRLWAYSAAFLCLSAANATVYALLDLPAKPPHEAVLTMFSIGAGFLAFRHAPLGRRTAIDRARLMLDGTAVAVAGALFLGYVVTELTPPETPVAARWLGGAIGVACLLALVVFGKAAVSPRGRVDPGALGLLAGTPIIGLGAVMMMLLGGGQGAEQALSVLGYPLVGAITLLAAYRQSIVLERTGAGRAPGTRPRWLIAEPLQFLAVAGTAALSITVSTRDLNFIGRAVIIGAVLIATIVVIRQLLGVRENQEALRTIRRQQAELKELALTDSLTGLPNRSGFSIALAERLEQDQPASSLLIDIDDFKMANDTLGPAEADQLLRQIAQRLRDGCGPQEVATRLGGDEFAVLLPVGVPEDAEAAAARLLLTLTDPLQAGGHTLLLNASAGIAIAQPGESADEVLRNADIAMYAAKESDKASCVRFEPQMRQNMVDHARLADELRTAIVRGELRLLYQPVFDLVTGRLSGAEALVRWQHPTRGLVSPGEFVPVAERTGLIVTMGAWVLREACEQLARWQAEYGAAAIEAINVNVAVRQLREADFVDQVAAVLSDTGLTSANLILEVTESSVVDGREVSETLQNLHEMGVRLALDDFGTGQSSLSLLRAFPVDVLKLDKSFVDGIADGADRGRTAIAAAVAQLAEHLQLKAVAEGIESHQQMDRLRQMGYRYGQGFYLARPLSSADCGTLMTIVGHASIVNAGS
ncbi:putative bifunctional diguanylate cyclase/phosphodiesterase [Actinoplanes xinjiangensis]|uniref:putative bifunctional diguanylate cyclase/phosphodiesterase n=1 Tax=Actinoplanes xinjiangensis TaxID=512350 RepID=UPI0034333806